MKHYAPMFGDPIELAWIAGFIEGDGSIGATSQGKKRGVVLLEIKVTQQQPEPLQRIAQVTGNLVTGPHMHPSSTSTKPFYCTGVRGNRALELMTLLWPYLSKTGKDRCKLAMQKAEKKV